MSLYAAVDIGSNSVRLAVADVVPGRSYRLVAAERQVTRIGESVFANGRVSEKAMQDTCQVLARFADVYSQWQPAAVRAVATSAMRDARNQAEFLARASEAVRTPIQIISGREEARLIHLGVLARWPRQERELLVFDIGGGSAEIIWSQKGQIRYSTSLPLGAVRLTQNFLHHDPPDAEELAELAEYIDQQMSGPAAHLGRLSQARAIGTSATALAAICAVNRIKGNERDEADGRKARVGQIRALYEKLSTRDVEGRRKVPGIGPRRAEIIIAGVAVLERLTRQFTTGILYYSQAGLRDGIIADLAARGVTSQSLGLDKDQKRVVAEMARRYAVPLSHARQVAALGESLFLGTATLHRLPMSHAKWLEAAAYLHDIGHYVSSIRHHRHSYYLVANSDMPGFTDREQLIVASLCRYHRKALPAEDHETFKVLKPEERKAVMLLIPLLRIADGLDRGHKQLVAAVSCDVKNGEARLLVQGKGGLELDLWAARQAATAFGEVYQTKLVVTAQR